MVLIVTATPREAVPLLAAFDDVTPEVRHGIAVGTGAVRGTAVALATTGIGRAATAFVLSRLLLDEPEVVIQVGVGGAFADTVGVGEVAVATTDTYADLGVRTDDGLLPAEELGFPLVTRDGTAHHDTFPCHPAATAAVATATGAVTGPFVTVETVTGWDGGARALSRRHAPLVESMEGAAGAHVCLLTDTPFVQVRGVSNLVGRRDRAAWRLDDAITAAADAALGALPAIVEAVT